MAAINLSSKLSYAKPQLSKTFSILIPIFHCIGLLTDSNFVPVNRKVCQGTSSYDPPNNLIDDDVAGLTSGTGSAFEVSWFKSYV